MIALQQPQPFRFSTNGLPARDLLKAVRELRERDILPIEPLPGRRVHLDIAKWSLPGLAILSGTLGGIRQEGTPVSAHDDLFYGVNVHGSGIVTQADARSCRLMATHSW